MKGAFVTVTLFWILSKALGNILGLHFYRIKNSGKLTGFVGASLLFSLY